MEQKISQLTETIYKEGVEKGEEEKKNIIDRAKKQAEKIINDAKKDAQKIKQDAQSEAEEIKRNTEREIALSGKQAVNEIKQEIVELISSELVDAQTEKALSDPDSLKEYILEIIKNWEAGKENSLEVMLPEKHRENLEKSLEKGLKSKLKDGVSVSFSGDIKGGFQIKPEGSSFKISITDEDFKEFFKEYIRPRTRKFIFGE